MYFMYISPTISEIKGLAAEKAEYDSVLLKAGDISAKTGTILEEYNSIPEEDIAKLNKIITNTYDSVAFANDLNNLATDFGLSVVGIKDSIPNASNRADAVVDSSNPTPFKTNIVNLSLTGDYDKFVSFLTNLESSLRLIDVKSLSVNSLKTDESKIDSYDFKLEIIVYSLN